jgi:hypothetical protein
VAFSFEGGGETAELSGFSGAVEAFEGDEMTARHRVSLPQGRRAHPKCKAKEGLEMILVIFLIILGVFVVGGLVFGLMAKYNNRRGQSGNVATGTQAKTGRAPGLD